MLCEKGWVWRNCVGCLISRVQLNYKRRIAWKGQNPMLDVSDCMRVQDWKIFNIGCCDFFKYLTQSTPLLSDLKSTKLHFHFSGTELIDLLLLRAKKS